jgi:hypothetical protein
MTLRQKVTEVFKGIQDAGVLVEILEGREIPPLTDYLLQPIPETWNAPPPPELVNGMTLLPAFTTGDWNAIYCIDEGSGQVFNINPETPWPPAQVFASCREFTMHLFRVVSENQTGEVKSKLQELMRVAEPGGS